MAKFASTSVLDGGSDVIRAAGAVASRVKMHVIKAYTAGDTYATVIAASCGSVDMLAADYVQSSISLNRRTTIAAKSITLTVGSGAAPNLHIAHVDSVSSVVLYVADETTDQVLTAGNTFNVPAHTFDVNQPV